MDDAFLTIAEIAETLKVNQQTVRNWVDRGELSAVRVGQRRVRVRQADLDRFLDSATALKPEPAGSEDGAERGSDRAPLTEVVTSAQAALVDGDDPQLVVTALRQLASAATALADALEP